MELKTYQKETLATLRRFFRDSRVSGPKVAYETIVREPEQKARLSRYVSDYRALEAVPQAPYVCLRLPTGGGKTLLAAHAVAVARDTWIEKDHPLVLWLVPTNTIRLQTVDALKNTRHAYRQALDAAFDGRVRIFDIADFPMIRPQDLRDQTCVVVGTIQTLRVANTEGRKVYKGAMLAGAGNDDTNEKRLVGDVWERASDGKGLFAMIENEVAGRNMRDQLIDKIAGKT